MFNNPLHFSPVTGEKANGFIPLFSSVIWEMQRGKILQITIDDEIVKSPEFVILRELTAPYRRSGCNDRRISAVVLWLSTILSTLQLFEILHSYLIQNDILLFLILCTSLSLSV